MAWYNIEDRIRHLPYFAVNTTPFVNQEEAKYKRPAKTYIDPKKIVDGKFSYLTTKRELYDDYKHWMRITVQELGISFFSFGAAAMLSINFLGTHNPLIGLAAVALAWFSGMKYRHAVGKYGNIKDFEDMPIVLPIMNLYHTTSSAGMDVRRIADASSYEMKGRAADAVK